MFSPIVVIIAMILDTIIACAYLAYSAVLVRLGVTASNAFHSKILVFFGVVLFVYVFLNKGGYSSSATSIMNTGNTKDGK